MTGGSGDDTIHIGGDPPTLVFDPPSFTYTPPPFEVPLPPELVYDEFIYDLDGFTFTVSLFEWIARGGLTDPQAAAEAIVAELRSPISHAVFSLLHPLRRGRRSDRPAASRRASATTSSSGSARPEGRGHGRATSGSATGSATSRPRSKLIQPPDVTVDPQPFAFKAEPQPRCVEDPGAA